MSFNASHPLPYNASDPNATFLSASSLDFLLIELVPLSRRIAAAQLPPPLQAASASASASASAAPPQPSSSAPEAKHPEGQPPPHGIDDEEVLDAMRHRLDSVGYRVGQGLVEKFSRDRPRFNDTLDVIKFMCKDLWSLVFGKNIDNLKTNHRGVYVLTDNHFRPFARMSTATGGQAIARAQPFLWLPCGIIRGALAALGIDATIQAEINELPGAVFQIKTNSSRTLAT
ncbi:hypothetical protein N3K66_007442 [Trichothecium roseum]|uniref:Uncharacterized protein n=1 Tax=Trichothecium roseum TaxID=47278 RepID=A0ACC0UV95_9HYPO|nr:hypothetical protein N3K66_007442 [Trichothecium roseum]